MQRCILKVLQKWDAPNSQALRSRLVAKVPLDFVVAWNRLEEVVRRIRGLRLIRSLPLKGSAHHIVLLETES